MNAIYFDGAGVSIPNDERVIVVETEYLRKLVALLDVTPPRTIGTLSHLVLVMCFVRNNMVMWQYRITIVENTNYTRLKLENTTQESGARNKKK